MERYYIINGTKCFVTPRTIKGVAPFTASSDLNAYEVKFFEKFLKSNLFKEDDALLLPVTDYEVNDIKKAIPFGSELMLTSVGSKFIFCKTNYSKIVGSLYSLAFAHKDYLFSYSGVSVSTYLWMLIFDKKVAHYMFENINRKYDCDHLSQRKKDIRAIIDSGVFDIHPYDFFNLNETSRQVHKALIKGLNMEYCGIRQHVSFTLDKNLMQNCIFSECKYYNGREIIYSVRVDDEDIYLKIEGKEEQKVTLETIETELQKA